MNIFVHCTVSTQSLDYYRYLQASYKNLAKHPQEIYFYAYCLDSECAEILHRSKATTKVVKIRNSGGSVGHALAVEAAIQNFVPAHANLLADTDTVMLLKGWDETFQKLFESYQIIGITVYEDIGGFSSGSGLLQTYKNMPTVTWMLFGPDLDVRNLTDLQPDKNNPLLIVNDELSRIYNLPIGYSVVKDVGWQIPEYLYRNKIRYLTLKPIKPDSANAVVLKGGHWYHDEFHYDGKPFLAHQRGSMKHRFRIDPLSRYFYNYCESYLGKPPWAVGAPFRITNILNRAWYDRLNRHIPSALKRLFK